MAKADELTSCKNCGYGSESFSMDFERSFPTSVFICPNCKGDPYVEGTAQPNWQILAAEKYAQTYGSNMTGNEENIVSEEMPPGIPSAESIGDLAIFSASDPTPLGILSQEALGAPIVRDEGLLAIGIPSLEALGTPIQWIPTSLIVANMPIPSAEALGTPTVLDPGNIIFPQSIPSAEVFPVWPRVFPIVYGG